MNMNEICVPEGALQLSGEDGAGVSPSEGDEVSMTVEGVVTRAGDGMIYVKAKSVNGEAIQEEQEAMNDGAGAMDAERQGIIGDMMKEDIYA